MSGIVTYLLAINVVTFAVFAFDKAVAATGNRHARRVPEVWLLGLCLVGGSVGGLMGMYALRHKTRKWYFVWGLPAFLVLDAGVIFFAHTLGLV